MKKQIGFTLIELIVSVALITIVLSAAVPTFQSVMERKSIQSITPLFERSIKYARSEAIQRRVTVHVAPSISGSNWATGWTVKSVSSTGAETLIRNFSGLPGSVDFTSVDFNTTTPLIILSTGEAETTGGFTLNYANCTGDNVIDFQVLISGLLKKSLSPCP